MTKKILRQWLAHITAAASTAILFTGAANAAGVDAGTGVSNTFSLDYQVNSVIQPTIDNTADPTVFTVDRLVDLTVATQGNTNVSPGATNQDLVFGVTNDGNDNQAYDLSLQDVAGDDFDATGLTIRYYTDTGDDGIFTPGVDDSGPGIAYTLGSATNDVAPDATIWVVISGDIPSGATDGQSDGVTLLADTLNPTTSLDTGYTIGTSTNPGYSATPGTVVTAAAVANDQDGEAQNVLNDGTGTATAGDVDNDGAHSDTGFYIVAGANLTATKTVSVIATDGASITCATDPAVAGNQYAAPGACVEYIIQATNDAGASTAATDIDISDILPDEVDFVGAVQSGFTTAGALSTPVPACASSCTVDLTGASLDPGDTGTLTIRATVR